MSTDYDDYYDEGFDYPWVSQYGVVSYYDEDAEVREKRPVWITRKDGITQRYHVWGTYKGAFVTKRARFNWIGSPRDVGRAIGAARSAGFVPTGYIDIDANEFYQNPLSVEGVAKGYWASHGVETWI